MSSFPTLKTGAVMQYPAERSRQFSNQVLRFLDGSGQRFRDFAQPLHRWVIRLDAIDESELNQLREFFRIQDGSAGEFSFTDPWDGTVYPSCSLETDAMVEAVVSEGRCRTSL